LAHTPAESGRAKKGLILCVGASWDRLLPIVELNAEFKDFFNDPQREATAQLAIDRLRSDRRF
jgi:hypothetical protein